MIYLNEGEASMLGISRWKDREKIRAGYFFIICGLILNFVVVTNAHAVDCKNISVQLLGIPLEPKLEKLDGYIATNYGTKGNDALIGFWKQNGQIQESIKLRYQDDAAYMATATYSGYSKNGASSKLDQILSIVGESNLSRRKGDPRPFYYVNCDKGMSAALFINELHASKSISYIVNIFIRNEEMYDSIHGNKH